MRQPLLSALLLGLLAACQAASEAGALDPTARAVVVVTREAPEGYLADLDPVERTQMEAEGYVFRNTEIVYPAKPLAGYFLQVGGVFTPIDRDGIFSVPSGLPVKTALLYVSASELPLATLDITPALAPSADGTLNTVVYALQGNPVPAGEVMDNGVDGPTAPTPHLHGVHGVAAELVDDGCNRKDCRVSENVPPNPTHPELGGCCDDFDHSKGRIYGESKNTAGKLSALCTVHRVDEFRKTICAHWSLETVCLAEAAFFGALMPGCYVRHKYRFCQFLDVDDYGLDGPASVTVPVGGTVSWEVSNGTPDNETYVFYGGSARGTIVKNAYTRVGLQVMGNTGAWVEHYDDALKTHVRTRTVTYQAPATLRADETEATDYLTFTFYGVKKLVTVRVVQQQCGSRFIGMDGLADCVGDSTAR